MSFDFPEPLTGYRGDSKLGVDLYRTVFGAGQGYCGISRPGNF